MPVIPVISRDLSGNKTDRGRAILFFANPAISQKPYTPIVAILTTAVCGHTPPAEPGDRREASSSQRFPSYSAAFSAVPNIG
jgi:hypothetical protein